MKTEKPTALLIEDIVPVLKDISRIFEEEGFEILAASDENSALKVAVEGKPDIIILDLELPEPEIGRKLCVRLANLMTTPPIIMLAQQNENLETSLIREGAIEFIEKPFNVMELVALARTQLMRSEKLVPSQVKVGVISYNARDNRLDFPDGEQEFITPAEKTIFEKFLESGDGFVTKLQLMKALNYAPNANTKTVETHIWRIRSKIRSRIDGYPTIVTLRNGKGYQLIR